MTRCGLPACYRAAFVLVAAFVPSAACVLTGSMGRCISSSRYNGTIDHVPGGRLRGTNGVIWDRTGVVSRHAANSGCTHALVEFTTARAQVLNQSPELTNR
jgi:hypothetical protein